MTWQVLGQNYTHERLHNICSHFVFLKSVLLVLLFNEPWSNSLKGQNAVQGNEKTAFLYSTMNRSALISYFMMTHHKFFWRPSRCFWGLQAVSVHNSSAAPSPSHPHLFCCAGRQRAIPSLSPSVCFSCPSANSTPLTCFIWLFQCLPYLSPSAHGEDLQLSSTYVFA